MVLLIIIPVININPDIPFTAPLRTTIFRANRGIFVAIFLFRSLCSQPFGINTPGAFAFVFNIIYPVYFSGPGTPTEK